MRTIANLNGVEFLRAINRTRHAVGNMMDKTEVLKIWKKMPTYTGKETPEERHEMARNQIKQNLNDMLDTLLEKHPESTYECIMAMCVRDEGEPEPDGIEMVMAAFNLISDKRVLDFLLQLGKSGLLGTDN
jgi:hypothetical protein